MQVEHNYQTPSGKWKQKLLQNGNGSEDTKVAKGCGMLTSIALDVPAADGNGYIRVWLVESDLAAIKSCVEGK